MAEFKDGSSDVWQASDYKLVPRITISENTSEVYRIESIIHILIYD